MYDLNPTGFGPHEAHDALRRGNKASAARLVT